MLKGFIPSMVDEVVSRVVTGPGGSAGYTSIGPTPNPHPPAPRNSVLKTGFFFSNYRIAKLLHDDIFIIFCKTESVTNIFLIRIKKKKDGNKMAPYMSSVVAREQHR